MQRYGTVVLYRPRRPPLRSGAPWAGVVPGWQDPRIALHACVEVLVESLMAPPQDFLVLLSDGEDGQIVATCPAIPGCISQGHDRAEALRNVREAIALCLETREEEGWELPL